MDELSLLANLTAAFGFIAAVFGVNVKIIMIEFIFMQKNTINSYIYIETSAPAENF